MSAKEYETSGGGEMIAGLEKYSIHELASAIREKGGVCCVFTVDDVKQQYRHASSKEAGELLKRMSRVLEDMMTQAGWSVIENGP